MNKKIISKIFIYLTSIFVVSTIVGCKNDPVTPTGYDVTFHAGEGHTINNNESYTYSKKTVIDLEPSPDPKEKYIFTGWYKSKNPTTTDEPITFPLTVTTNLDLYASYKMDADTSHIVHFHAGEGATSVPDYLVNVSKGEGIEVEPTTSKENYTFLGWYDAEKGGNKITFSHESPYMPTESKTDLYAHWEKIEKYEVYFHTDGSAPKNTEVQPESPTTYKLKESVDVISTTPYTYLQGNNFTGWFASESSSEILKFPLTITGVTHLYAKFEEGNFTVTLKDYDADSKEVTKQLTYCTFIAYQPEPIITKSSLYEFKGWKKEGSEDIIDFKDGLKVEKDITLIGVWEERKEFNVSYYDGDTLLSTSKYKTGDSVLSPYDYKKAHYDILGWKLDNTGDIVTFPYKVEQSDCKFYAVTKRSSCNIIIKNSEDETTIKTLADIKTLAKPDVTIEGRESDYTVDYYTYKDKTTKIDFTNDLDIKNIESTFYDGDTVPIYVFWKDRTYNITLDYNDKSQGIEGYASVIYRSKTSFLGSDLPTVRYEGYKISGWKDEDGNTYGLTDTIKPKEMTLKAIWEKEYFDLKVIRVNPSTSTSSETTINNFPVHGALSLIPIDKYDNYSLSNFYVKLTGAEEVVQPTTYTIVDYSKVEYVKEKWDLTSYTVKINYGDGYDVKVLYQQAPDTTLASLPTIIKQDFKFKCFSYGGEEKESTATLHDLAGTTTETIELTAIWEREYTSIKYNYNYDGCPSAYIVNHVTHYNTTTHFDPTRSSYDFKGWYDNKECTGTAWDKTSGVALDLTKEYTELFAKWEQQEVSRAKVTFNVGSQQALAKFSDSAHTGRSLTMESSSAITYDNFPKVECEGNILIGWYEKEVGTGDPVTSVATGETKVLYARWRTKADYVTLYLNIPSQGQFELNSNDTVYHTIKSGTSWSSIKDLTNFPKVIYPSDDGLALKHWSATPEGASLDESTTFTTDMYLYAVNFVNIIDERIGTHSFTTDNWPTLCNIAKTKEGYDEEGQAKTYDTCLDHLKAVYKNDLVDSSFVGLERGIYFDTTKYTVRVIDENKDYTMVSGSETKYYLPLTFEFTECLPYASQFNTANGVIWSGSSLRTKLLSGGFYYNRMQYSVRLGGYFTDTYKMSVTSGDECVNNLFIASYDEYWLDDTWVESSAPEVTYAYYKKSKLSEYQRVEPYKTARQDLLKQFKGVYTNYWLRNATTSSSGAYFIETSSYTSGSITYEKCYNADSEHIIGRPFAPLFCIGAAV